MNLLGSDLYDLDLLTILIVYLLLSYGESAVGVFAFGQGFLIDLFSGGLQGLFTSLYLAVFGAVHLGRRLFDLEGVKGRMIVIFLAVLLRKALFVFFQSIFAGDMVYSRSFILISAASALITGLVAPVFFSLFDFVRGVALSEALEEQT
jgi:rod shape-determining protein MreD